MAVKGEGDGLHTIFRFKCDFIDFPALPVAEGRFFDHLCLKVDFPITQARRVTRGSFLLLAIEQPLPLCPKIFALLG